MATLAQYGLTDQEILAARMGNGMPVNTSMRSRATIPYHGSPQGYVPPEIKPGPMAAIGRASKKFMDALPKDYYDMADPLAAIASDVVGNIAGVGAGLGSIMSSNLTGRDMNAANNLRKRVTESMRYEPATEYGRNALAKMGEAMMPIAEPVMAGFDYATQGMDQPSKEMLAATALAGLDVVTGGRARGAALIPDAPGTAWAGHVRRATDQMRREGAFAGMSEGQIKQVERAMFSPQERARVMNDPVMAQAVDDVADFAYAGYAAERAALAADQVAPAADAAPVASPYPDPYFDEVPGRRPEQMDPLYPEPIQTPQGQLMPRARQEQMGYGIQEWSKPSDQAADVARDATDLRYPLGGEDTPVPGPNVANRRVAKTGQYRGAPQGLDSPQKLAGLRKRLKGYAIDGLAGRDWYDRSSASALEISGLRPGVRDRYAAMNAITSSGTNVQSNTMSGIKAYNQGLNQDPIAAGRFPVMMGRDAQRVWDAGERWYQNMPDLGDKRWPFYNALRVDPTTRSPGQRTTSSWPGHSVTPSPMAVSTARAWALPGTGSWTKSWRT